MGSQSTSVERMFYDMDTLAMRPIVVSGNLYIRCRWAKHRRFADELLRTRPDMVDTLTAWVALRDMEVPCG